MSAIRQPSTTEDGPITPVYALPIDHPSAWKPADFTSPAEYTIELTASQLRDVDHAIARIKAAGLGLDDLGREHFELPSLRPVIDEIRRQIKQGRGFVVVRRLPVEAYSKDDLGMIFWGIGTHLGHGLSQSVLGDRLGHVKDFSREDPLAHADETEQTSHHIRDRQSQDSYCANRDSRMLRTSVSTTTACSCCCRPSSPQPSMRNPG